MNILKVRTPVITDLTYIPNKSLSSGIFPSWLIFSEIKPLHIKGDRTDIANFRPIFLHPFHILWKNVINTRLYQHIQQNNILATEQYGFRNNSSTGKASFKLINELLLALNNKLTVSGIFCDLEKAFVSINHDILLSKCEFYGFRDKTNALLRSYLSDRYQKVLLNNNSSNSTTFSEWGKIRQCSSRFNTLSFVLLNLYKWSSEYNNWPIDTDSVCRWHKHNNYKS